MKTRSLDDWLDWQLQHHPVEIDLGLGRVRAVASAAGLLKPSWTLVTVAGTNGKGSSVAMLESILKASGVLTGSYTSPHVHRYNERIKIGGIPVSDESLCTAFAAIDQARGSVSLSFFEWGTLAAIWVLEKAKIEVGILEVGLGGRLDAVNILDADTALITAIGVDHTDWLGDTREAISLEKLGVGRMGKPMIASDPHLPEVFTKEAAFRGIPLLPLGQAFDYHIKGEVWDWCSQAQRLPGLPLPALAGEHQVQNASGVLAALESLKVELRHETVAEGLRSVSLPGRFERLPGDRFLVLDVAHNQDSAQRLRDNLKAETVEGRTWCLLGMLKDKDYQSMILALADEIDAWVISSPRTDRALDKDVLSEAVRTTVGKETFVTTCESLEHGLAHVLERMTAMDRLLITGSFFTVAEVRARVFDQEGNVSLSKDYKLDS